MDLIIKPTQLCNFKCTFCSSTQITESNKDVLDLSQVARFLDRFPDTKTIIINGGDPLMLPPQYYWDLLALLEARGMDRTTLSFTSNLWDFYKHPEKWETLFKHSMVGVGTSFHYGDSRRISERRVFTEEDFLKISDMMLERVGFRPDFISVIDRSNLSQALANVELAKRLGVVCKLNYVNASGRQGQSLLMGDIYRVYLDVYRAGLMDWEYNTKQVINRWNRYHTTCPLNRDCDAGIRAMNPNGEYYSCGAFSDDRLYRIDFDAEMASDTIQRPLLAVPELFSMHEGCFGCEMFEQCNGCRKTVHDVKQSGRVEEHCQKMKALIPDFQELAEEQPRPINPFIPLVQLD